MHVPARLLAAGAMLSVACGATDPSGQRLATFGGGIWSFAAGPTNLYVRAYPEGTKDTASAPLGLYEVEPTGKYRKLLDTPGFYYGPPRLAVAGTQLYFTMMGPNGGIGAYETTSGTQRTMIPATNLVWQLLADTGRVYWVDDSQSDRSLVHAMSSDGTGVTVVDHGSGIFQDEQALYWLRDDGEIVRASKSDLTTRSRLATAKYGYAAAAAFGGNVYWSPVEAPNQVLTIPADGTATTPTVLTTEPVGAYASQVVAIQQFAGSIYLAVADRQPGECCLFNSRVMLVDTGKAFDVTHGANVRWIPGLAASTYGLFWTTVFDLYRVR